MQSLNPNVMRTDTFGVAWRLRERQIAFSVAFLFSVACIAFVVSFVADRGWSHIGEVFPMLLLVLGLSLACAGIPFWGIVFESLFVMILIWIAEVGLGIFVFRFHRNRACSRGACVGVRIRSDGDCFVVSERFGHGIEPRDIRRLRFVTYWPHNHALQRL